MGHHNAKRDAYIPVRKLRRVGRMAVGGRAQDHHSPVNADLTGMPPALIICGEDEVLRVDAELMAEKLLDSGVRCTLQIWERQVHAFPVIAELNPESLAAIEEVAVFARDIAAPAAGHGPHRAAPHRRRLTGRLDHDPGTSTSVVERDPRWSSAIRGRALLGIDLRDLLPDLTRFRGSPRGSHLNHRRPLR